MSWKEQAEEHLANNPGYSFSAPAVDEIIKKAMSPWETIWGGSQNKPGRTYKFACKKTDNSYDYIYTYRITLQEENQFYAEKASWYKSSNNAHAIPTIKDERWIGSYQKTDSEITFTNTKKGKLIGNISVRVETDVFEDSSSWSVKLDGNKIEWADQTLHLVTPDTVEIDPWQLPVTQLEKPKPASYDEPVVAASQVNWTLEQKKSGTKTYKRTSSKNENGHEETDSYRITLMPQYKFYAEHIWTSKEVGSDKKPAIKDERWIGTYSKQANAITFKNTNQYVFTCPQLDANEEYETSSKGLKERKIDTSSWKVQEANGKVIWGEQTLA